MPSEEIAATLSQERARKAAWEAAQAGAEKLRGGADWSAVAGEDKPEEPGLVERLPAGAGQRSHPLSLRPSKRFARPAREGAGPVRVRTAGRGPQEPH